MRSRPRENTRNRRVRVQIRRHDDRLPIVPPAVAQGRLHATPHARADGRRRARRISRRMLSHRVEAEQRRAAAGGSKHDSHARVRSEAAVCAQESAARHASPARTASRGCASDFMARSCWTVFARVIVQGVHVHGSSSGGGRGEQEMPAFLMWKIRAGESAPRRAKKAAA